MAENEMQRRVRKAIHESFGYDTPWETCTQCEDAARAAIEAMREPTEAMVKAGVPDFASHNDDFDPMETAIHNVYVSMIDAALSPETGK